MFSVGTFSLSIMKVDPHQQLPEEIDPAWRIGIIHSSYYKEEVERLVQGAVSALKEVGISNISLHPVPGSFEIPLLGAALAEEKKVDALIGLGIIVEGETHHAKLVADSVTRGIMDVQTTHQVPFAFEVLYVKDLLQAQERIDKGKEAAEAILHSLAQIQTIRS